MHSILSVVAIAAIVATPVFTSTSTATTTNSTSLGTAPEPWLPLHGGGFTGPAAPFSPDPLVQYQWPLFGPNSPVNQSLLQIYTLPAVECGPSPDTNISAFLNTSSAVGSLTTNITVVGIPGTLIVDFGVESAAWVEFDSPDLQPTDAKSLVVGISEYNVVDYVGAFKQGQVVAYAGGTYRLETNQELYEGVRYAFITVPASSALQSFTITALRLVVQAKAVNYTGSFSSAGDPILESVWYTAAYTVRATLQANYMGSILMDRGDRFSWAGDAHPSEATAMAAFAAYPQVIENIVRGKDDCQGIATYCLYLILSISDYFFATGDVAGVANLTQAVQTKLENAATLWLDPTSLRFVGWDDRCGSGFANNTTPETQAIYRLLAIRAWTEAATFLNATGNSALATRYAAMAVNRTAEIRTMGGTPWYGTFGLHAGADAVNAGFLTPQEQAGIGAGAISDIVKLPSQSNFNQYFILQALSGLGQLDRGAESIRVVWGPILSLDATTFWETSHPSAAEIFPPGPSAPAAEQSGWVSLCHPWSSGAAPWMTKWLLGIRPLSPGYRQVLVAPHISRSMSGVNGGVGTPYGIISIAAQRKTLEEEEEGVVAVADIHITIPHGIERATLRLTAVLLSRLGFDIDLTDADSAAASIMGRVSIVDSISGQQLVAVLNTAASDAPLLNESAPGSARAPSLEIFLSAGTSYVLHVSAPAPLASTSSNTTWVPLESPFPPPAWPGNLVSTDTLTQGSWRGVYGADGYFFPAFLVPSVSPTDPFCGTASEGDSVELQCADSGATISTILYASFGAPSGSCPAFTNGTCNAPSSLEIVRAACLGKSSCSIPATNEAFGGDPCPGTPKNLAVVAHCSSGGGMNPNAPVVPIDVYKLPSYVTSVRVVTYDGFCASTGSWTNSTDDLRALEDPNGTASSPRHLGYTQPCGCPTSPVDIVLTDAAKAAGLRYRLSVYYVDWSPSPSCPGLDGTARTQETYLLTGYPDLSPAAPREALSDFSEGIWLTWEVTGDIRVRISTVRGDMAVLSALAFDPVPS